MPRIVLEGVSKFFAAAEGRSVTAVDALTLEVNDREMLALVGPSGCGKTTMLRLISGLEVVDSGTIRFDGEVVTHLPPVKRDVAMVFQSHALLPHLTAFENLAFGLKLRHVPTSEVNSRVHEAAEWLGIAHCLERKPAQLSGGERQRVALGRALVRRPRILLLDEPLSHLDEPLRVQLRTELRTLHSRLNMTTISVTHDQAEALALGDRVAVMRDGRLQQSGSPQEVYATPANAFVAGFIGSPAMNLFQGTIAKREDGFVFLGAISNEITSAFVLALRDCRTDWLLQNIGRRVTLGIRPECINPANNGTAAGSAISAVVQSVEYAGARTMLRLTACGQSFVACIGSSDRYRPAQTITLAFDLNRARVYDHATGALLLSAL
jgi:multiple sugar transport system ATP-binding protein